MVVARTSSGVLRGERRGPVCAFLGVPYAAPPTGPQRWRGPEPPAAWTGERDATRFGPVPPQDIAAERLAKRGLAMGEDCLTVNVWTPAPDAARRPTVVFLHGGGVVTGMAAAPLLDGAVLATRGDLVVVTVGFRLGALGSLNSHQQHDIPTNLAFRDQLEAMRWVRDEIEAFGGDPGQVTLMGQSSGAVAIACMLASPAAEGLFDRAILQSGGLERVRSPEAAAAVAGGFFDALGEPAGPGSTVPVQAILAAQGAVPTGFVPPVGPWHHAVDGDVVPVHPMAANRPFHPVPVLAGASRDEWRVFDLLLDDDELTDDFLRQRAGALAGEGADVDDILDRYRSVHGVRTPEQRRSLAAALVTDFHFAATTEQFARAHAAAGNDVFHYELGWPSPRPGLGACHDTCLPLVFGTMDRVPALVGTGPEVTAISETVQDAWIAFIRTGDPSTPALGRWPRHDSDRQPTMLLGAEPSVAERHRDEQLSVWEGRYPASG